MPATDLPPDLLARPAAEGARLVALGYLEQATAALGRLGDPGDREALHDFRVAMRRLRSTLRAYRPLFADSVSKTQRRRLRDVGDRTNAGRDAEVQLAWLRAQEGAMAPRERAGLRWLIAHVEARRAAEYDEAIGDAQAAFGRVARRLRRRLREYRAHVPGPGDPIDRFGRAAGSALADTSAAFSMCLAALHDPGDAAAAHAARIAAKRVRYLLEPIGDAVPGGPSLVRRLKSLQDLLGEFNDCHVLEAEIAAGAAAIGGERARRLHEVALADGRDAARRAGRVGRDPRPGLLAVARLLRDRRRDLFQRLEEEWLADGGRGFAEELAVAARALTAWRPKGGPAPRPARRATRRVSR